MSAVIEAIETQREISHLEALKMAARLINGHPRITHPADPDHDDDLLLVAYIVQQARKQAAIDAALSEKEP